MRQNAYQSKVMGQLNELSPHWRSKDKDLICLQCPLSFQVEVAVHNSFDLQFRLEPASLTTGASGGYLAALHQGAQHAFEIVITIRGFLSPASAQHAVAGQEKAHLGFAPL